MISLIVKTSRSIRDLKREIQDLEGVPIELQQLFRRDSDDELEDKLLLSDKSLRMKQCLYLSHPLISAAV